MSYLGRGVDKISNIEKLDNITFNGASSYTLQKGGVNFVPTSAAAILISIDGVVQSGNFTVSSSTIDFGTAVASTSTCNFIIHLGTGVLTAPSDGSVTNAKLGTAPTLEAKGSGGTAGGVKYFCEAGTHGITLRSPQHSAYSGSYELVLPTAQGSANTFLKNDGSGNLSFAAAGGDNTPAFQAKFGDSTTQSISSSVDTKVQFNEEVFDTDSTYDNSTNYRFTPGVAGKYYLYAAIRNTTGTDFDVYRISIRKNGTQIQTYMNVNRRNNSVSISATVDSNTTDYFEIYVSMNNANSLGNENGNNGDANYFGGYKLIT